MKTIENLKVAVLMGGPGSERDVSLASGNAVLNAFKSIGVDAVKVDVTEPKINLPEGTGIAVNVIHGTFGEDGQLQKQMEELGIPYTGAGAVSSELAFDKVESKKVFVEAGVPTPACEIINCTGEIQFPKMALPYVVKPPREGSSVGVHIAHTQEEAEKAIADASQYGDEILVEQFVEGKELTVGILNGVALPVVHIVPRSGFYDIANKYPWMTGDGGTDYFCPAELGEELTAKVQAAAVAAHNSLNIEVYSRVDVLLDADGNPYVLEANTIPGMTESSLLPKAAQAHGINFPELCVEIANISLNTSRT